MLYYKILKNPGKNPLSDKNSLSDNRDKQEKTPRLYPEKGIF
jgi:hypothetical protein